MDGRAGTTRWFNLSRWFGVVAFVSIATMSALAGLFLTQFVSGRMLWQEGELTKEFVDRLLLADLPLQAYFAAPAGPGGRGIEAAFDNVSRMPDVLQTNIYDRTGRIVWSSDAAMIDQRFPVNNELDTALGGRLVVHAYADDTRRLKAEHPRLTRLESFFVEIYVPVHGGGDGPAIGAIELYKSPARLFNALQRLRAYIAVGAALAGLFLYLALFGLVRRADLLIREQQRRLVDTETLAAIGEMSAAVAHGIRNPLASIRSSAELIVDADGAGASEAAQDIVAESDRLEAWLRELLAYSRPIDDRPEAVELHAVVARTLEAFGRELERRAIHVDVQLPADLPPVRANPLLLGQVVHGLIANAIEAMPGSGRLTVAAEAPAGHRRIVLRVEDDGPGMTAEQLARAGKPFFTTKTRGLGVGLALARRIMERFGAELEIDSAAGKGTRVTLRMQRA